jgi:hypothetical protein
MEKEILQRKTDTFEIIYWYLHLLFTLIINSKTSLLVA